MYTEKTRMIISIVNTTDLDRQEVQHTLRAVNRQLQGDFRRYWHTYAELRLEGLSIPSYSYKMANILLYSLCSASSRANSSSNGRNRWVGQLGICS